MNKHFQSASAEIAPELDPTTPDRLAAGAAVASAEGFAPVDLSVSVPPEEGPASRRLTPRLAIVLILLQSVIYGFGDPITKDALAVTPVYALLSVRYLLALALLFLFGGKKIVAGLRNCRVRDWIWPALCIGVAHLTGNVALQFSAATSTAFLRSLSTVMTPPASSACVPPEILSEAHSHSNSRGGGTVSSLRFGRTDRLWHR